jgi:hypothetical protein
LPRYKLFAQPADFEPVLRVDPGIYPAYTAADEGRSIHLTDAGKAAWLTALRLYPRVSLRLESYESSDREWAITLATPAGPIVLRCACTRRKGVQLVRSVRNHIVSLEISAGRLAAVQFVQAFREQLGRDPAAILEPEDFTAVFAVSVRDAAAAWSDLLGEDIAARLRDLQAEVVGEAAVAERALWPVAEQAHSLLAQSETAIRERNFDLAMSVLETARGALSDARGLAEQEGRQREQAADMISFVQTAILKAAGSGLETARAQKLLAEASAALSGRSDGEAAAKLAMQARSLVEVESHKRDQARSALEASRSLIADARDSGLDVARAAQLSEKAQSAIAGHNYVMVQHYATTIRKVVSALKEEHRLKLDRKEAAEYAIDASRKVMNEALRFDCDMTVCSHLVKKADQALERGDYDSALELAETGRATAEEVMRNCAEAMDAVQLATTLLRDAGAFIDTRPIEPYLDRAWEALRANDYPAAGNAATLCRDMIEVAEVESEPRIEVKIARQNLKPGLWNRSRLDILNSGAAHARNISVKLSGLLEATRLRRILFLRSGEGFSLEAGLKPAGAGELAYDVETSCQRAYDGVGYTSKVHRWLNVAVDSTSESPDEERPAERPGPAAPPEEPAGMVMEEVYVVFHDGRLILHQARRDTQEVDEMSLSSLLTAVQTFIKESFRYETGGLGKLEFGNLKMVLEHGRLIYIAAVLSGREPPELRQRMRRLIEDIERTRFDSSGLWDGNMSAFEDLQPRIQELFEPGAGAPARGA